MIYSFLLILHLLVSIFLVVVILLQSSKGGGLAGSAFGGGGGGSNSFLGARGTASFLSRATTVLAVIFMLNSLGLSFMLRGSSNPVSVTQQEIQSGASALPRIGDEGRISIDPQPTLPADDTQETAPLTLPPDEGDPSGGESTE